MIHSYWLKKLTALHECLEAQMNQPLRDGTHPDWLTKGWTFLIMRHTEVKKIHPKIHQMYSQ